MVRLWNESLNFITFLAWWLGLQNVYYYLHPDHPWKQILECLGFNNVRTEEEVGQRLQILDASLYLEYRKPHVITVGCYSHNHSAGPVVLLLYEKKAKQVSYISNTGDLLPAYTHSSGSKLVGNWSYCICVYVC